MLQPLTGTAAAGGKTALVGSQMAVDRVNKSGGVNGRPMEAIVVDYESKPDVGRRKAEKLTLEDKVDVVEGGYLSNVCLACMPVFEEAKTVYMIGVCLDTTITQSKCSRYVFRPFDFAPAQAVAAAPYMVNKMGKKWHISYADYAWGQSTKDAFAAEIKKNGGEVVGTLGIPLGTTELTPFLSKISGQFDGHLRHLLRAAGHRLREPELRSRAQQEVQDRRATAPSRCPPACRPWAPRPRASSASTATSRCWTAC